VKHVRSGAFRRPHRYVVRPFTNGLRQPIEFALCSKPSQSALPQDYYTPSCGDETLNASRVTCNVPGKLGLPELPIALRGGGEPATGVSMPKATVHHHDNTKLAKNKIWNSGQATIMKSEPKSASMQVAPHDHLRFSIATSYAGHHSGPDLRFNNVCQSIPPKLSVPLPIAYCANNTIIDE
jgi:hypothetical protein